MRALSREGAKEGTIGTGLQFEFFFCRFREYQSIQSALENAGEHPRAPVAVAAFLGVAIKFRTFFCTLVCTPQKVGWGVCGSGVVRKRAVGSD